MEHINKIIHGNCLEKLKELPENSVDSIVTDPPYELGFMGKSWDSTGIANNPELWKECLRVLKPGGHLLAFGGTRTYHRMAVAIEDAGFEVRDMIEWVYGSGFPKSLNIGKSIENKMLTGNASKNGFHKLDGERREGRIGMYDTVEEQGFRKVNPDQLGAFDLEPTTHEAKEWNGWGTALKPAHEPICMARKPLEQQELDIAKNICYNITEKGLITNSKILWRINNVKSAEKQKTKQSSIPTQQQKTVEVSAEFVETKENESVGKKIQKLIENICESGIQETGNKLEKQVPKVISKTETGGQNITENTSEKEKKNLLSPMEESVSVVENQDLSSLPLTTLEVAEDSTEKKSKTETSMSSLKSTDTQKTDTDYSAQTATSQWVCMDIVRILKVSFEGKEYDFIELSDGSLVWNENLEPYRKQQKLNVAENVLKYGTGGINIDESRVEGNWGGSPNRTNSPETKQVYGDYGKIESEQSPLGRFPANLIHDNSEEVRECFPESKSAGKYKEDKLNTFKPDKAMFALGYQTNAYAGDSGNASRFFKSIIYQAKASKSERNKGCEELETTEKFTAGNYGQSSTCKDCKKTINGSNDHSNCSGEYFYNESIGKNTKNNHPTVKPIALMEYLIKMVTPKGGTVLDPFAGSGSTLVAAKQNGYKYIGIEMTEEYLPIINARLGL